MYQQKQGTKPVQLAPELHYILKSYATEQKTSIKEVIEKLIRSLEHAKKGGDLNGNSSHTQSNT